MTKKFDITIIGGSFAGISAGLALSQISADLKIAIIEKVNIKICDRKPDGRGYAISSKSLDFFKEVGILDEVTKEAGTIRDIKITDYKSPFFLDFLAKDIEKKGFGALIESYTVHNCLRDRLLKQENVEIFCPNSYEEINFDEENKLAKVKLDNGDEIVCNLLLACDGRFSKIREKFNIETKIKDYQQTAIVFNIEHKRRHENIAWEKFLPGGPLAILPLKNQNQSSIVWIAPDEIAKAILKLDEKEFAEKLQQKMENCLGDVRVISKNYSYPLKMVEAGKFYHENMLLVGDAACGVHPIAGQGFNLALESIVILRDLVKQSFLSGLSINSNLLIESYNKRAKFNCKKMVVATDLLNSLFETKLKTVGIARDIGLGMVNKINVLKKFFIKNAGGF